MSLSDYELGQLDSIARGLREDDALLSQFQSWSDGEPLLASAETT